MLLLLLLFLALALALAMVLALVTHDLLGCQVGGNFHFNFAINLLRKAYFEFELSPGLKLQSCASDFWLAIDNNYKLKRESYDCFDRKEALTEILSVSKIIKDFENQFSHKVAAICKVGVASIGVPKVCILYITQRRYQSRICAKPLGGYRAQLPECEHTPGPLPSFAPSEHGSPSEPGKGRPGLGVR